MVRAAAPVSPNGSGLQRLLELEDLLAARLASARSEADALLRNARDQAAAIAVEARTQEAEQERRLATRLAAEQVEERTALEAELAAYAARYKTLSAERIDQIARRVLDLLLESRR
jgi:hypothetical protein